MSTSATRLPRLDQLLASLGYGSRKDIDIAVKRDRVQVEGLENPRSDSRVDPHKVIFDGEKLDHPDGLLVLLHKPTGYSCTHSESEGTTIYDLLPPRWCARNPKVVSIGRLDRDTSGIILLTDQHDLVHRLTSPKNHVDKVYEAVLEKGIEPAVVKLFASGTLMLRSESKPCLPAKVEVLPHKRARITLSEGRYHQVRRMFGAAGSPVVSLHRTHFDKFNLDGVAEGQYKILPLPYGS